MTQKINTMMECCICGANVEDPAEYIEIVVSAKWTSVSQYFGSHAQHFAAVLAKADIDAVMFRGAGTT
jgi:hypothetical protein